MLTIDPYHSEDIGFHLSNGKKGPWWFRASIGDEILPNYMGIIINHYKDP